jgi:hypothetical protein
MKQVLIITGIFGVLFTLTLFAPAAWAEASLSLRLESTAFELTDGGIEMEGFGLLADPGKPQLPARTHLILLPPGARALGVEVIEAEISPLPGSHRIKATPAILTLAQEPGSPSLMREDRIRWEAARRTAYDSDEAYPAQPVWIVGAGSLRKYSYVALRFAPFAYHPRSGRLVHHRSVGVRIHYRLPAADSEEELHISQLLHERMADTKAARLFENFASMAPYYEPPGDAPGERDEIYDYVIITPASLEISILASGFAEWKTSLGHGVRIVRLSDPEITGQPGADLAARVRSFLREFYGPWGIQYALLVGSHYSVPMRYCFADPTNHQHNPNSPGDYGGSVPTDCYYADLSLSDAESWDLDGDGYLGEYGEDAPDFLAEISVGRIPSDVAGKISYTLEKIVRYEQDTGDWKDGALHGGPILFYENQDGMDVPFREGAVCMDLIETANMDGWTIDHYCEHDGLVPSGYDWPALTQELFTLAWRSGCWGMVNWVSHGSPDIAWRHIWTWDDGDGVFETDGSDGQAWEPFLTDGVELEDDCPSILWAAACSIGWPETNPRGNLGIDLLTRPGFGAAVGVVSATRTAHVPAYWPDNPGGTESMCCEFNRFLIDGPDGPELLGDAHFDSKFYCFVNYGWEHYREYKNQYAFNLYGDPSMTREGMNPTSVDESDPAAEAPGLVLHQNHPNPFNPTTTIRYDLPEMETVRFQVFDLQGRLLRMLVDGVSQSPGSHQVVWDGRDGKGRQVDTGLYFYRLEAGTFEQTERMVLIK